MQIQWIKNDHQSCPCLRTYHPPILGSNMLDFFLILRIFIIIFPPAGTSNFFWVMRGGNDEMRERRNEGTTGMILPWPYSKTGIEYAETINIRLYVVYFCHV
jgi:hypothetical protein